MESAFAELWISCKNLVEAVDNDMVRKYPDSFPGFASAIARAKRAVSDNTNKVIGPAGYEPTEAEGRA